MYNIMEICNCKVKDEEGVIYLYKYNLIESTKKISINDSSINVPCYGIEIISEKIENDKTVENFRDSLPAVSSVKEKVLNLIEFLRKNEVSPYHIIDIVGEYSDNWVGDFENDARCLMDSVSLV